MDKVGAPPPAQRTELDCRCRRPKYPAERKRYPWKRGFPVKDLAESGPMPCHETVAHPAEQLQQRTAALVAFGEQARRRALRHRAAAQRHLDFAKAARRAAVQ